MKRSVRTTTDRRRRGAPRSRRRGTAAHTLRRHLLLEAFEPRLVLAGVPQLIDLYPDGPSDPSEMVRIGNIAYFTAADGDHGRELWKTDGTPAGTSLVKDIRPGVESSDPTELTELNGTLYFAADDGLNGWELWRSDGTETGTTLVRDINPGEGYQYPTGYGNLSGFPKGLVVFQDRLMFSAEEQTAAAELWTSDGTAGGTALVKDIATGSSSSYYGEYPDSSQPQNFAVVNGTLFFSADDGVNGRELWKSDGTAAGTVMVKDIYAGSSPRYYYGNPYGDFPNDSRPAQLTAVNGTLFFAATDENGTELWKSDGTEAGTVMVKDIQPGSYGSLYGGNSLLAFQGRLLFDAENDTEGRELWISDGTAAGTTLVKDIRPGSVGSISSSYLTELNGVVYFAADDGTVGTELWKTDGTAAGTVLVSNLDNSTSGSFPRYLTEVGGRLYFSAFTADLGRELWESDGTDAGTIPVDDILAGTGSSSPRELLGLGQTLLFSADNGTAGRELYAVSAGNQTSEARLTIFVDGQAVNIPAGIGVSAGGTPLSQVRSFGAGGNLTVAPIADEPLETVTLGDFFATWRTNAGQAGNNPSATFSDQELMSNLADTTNTVQMFVNGEFSTFFEDYVIRDGDQIVLVYGQNPVLSLNTNFGPIVMELFAGETPGTVDNFLNYVNDNDYLNTFFHRSDPGFVIQGGGFATSSTTFTSVAQFTPINTDPPIQNEPGISNLRGTVAMAKLGGNPNSATSQFFVNLGDNSALDLPQNNSFTVFGQVLEMSTVDTIASLPIDSTNAPPFDELPVSANNQLVVIQAIEGHGRVSGIKFFDANSNGVFDNGESPLPGVEVFVDANQNGQLDVGEISTTTDSQGRYLLELLPGTYRVNAEVSDQRFVTLPDNALGYQVDVEIGREVTGADFGEDDLEPPTAVDLLASFDTGDSSSDNLTRRNNANGASVLQFQVDGARDGATVRVFSDGILIGSGTASGGMAVVTSDGATPLADGVHAITATQDLLGSQSTASPAISLTIDALPPAAIVSTPNSLAQVGDPYSFDADSPDEGQVTYALATAPAGMTIDAQTGLIAWTPTPDQAVPQQFDIQVLDPAGNASTQTVNLTVLGDPPAFPESYPAVEDTVLTVPAANGVLANDGDTESGPLTASLVVNAAHGIVVLDADGSFTYTPNSDFFGQDTFTYQAVDGDKVSNVALVTIQVEPQNDAPVALENEYTTPEDTPLLINATLGVLANDTDIDGDALLAVLANQPQHGTLLLDPDGSFTYTPDANFSGSDSFAYFVTDGTLQSDPVAVTLTITPVDDPPSAVADSYSVDEEAVLNVTAAQGVLANDRDPDGDATLSLLEDAAHGSVTLNADGSFSYTPDANFAGLDSFTYSLSDGVNQSIAAATITVVDQPDPPTANDDALEVVDDETSHVLDVLSNDTFSPDVEDTLTIVDVTQGDQGGNVSLVDGQLTYLPVAGFTGTETFQYTVRDSDGLEDTATVTVTVSEAAGNTVSGFVYLDRDRDGQRDADELGVPGALITLIGSSTAGATVNRTMITDDSGSYVFDDLPAGTYRVLEHQPTALADGDESSSVASADLDTNDQIANLVISGRQVFGENNFAETQLQSAYVSIIWFFASSTSSTALFRETIAMSEESVGNTDLAEAIRGGSTPPPATDNRAPVGSADSYSVAAGGTLTVALANGVLANDVDPDGNTLTAELVSNVTNGTLTLNADGSFSYEPDAEFAGEDGFTYRASDGSLTSSAVQVTITVERQENTFSLAENSPTGLVVGRVQLGTGQTLSYEIEDLTTPADLQLRPDDHLSGDPASALVLVEYLDLQCPNCEAIHPVVRQLESEFEGELLVVRRHLPLLDVHPNAFVAAVAAEAAGRQGMFDEMVDLMFTNQEEWQATSDPQPFFEDYADQLDLDLTQFRQDQLDPALAERVQRDADAAERLGATATPAFYLNGRVVDNEDAVDDFEAVIEDALQDFDQPFVINRTTGDLVVADGNQLNFESTPSFTFTVIGTDGGGNTSRTIVIVNLTDVNEASPVAFADTYQAAQNTTLTVDSSNGLLKNDTDADGDSLTALLVTSPEHGSVTLNDNGSFVYVPGTDFSGTDSFTYQASDGTRTSNIASVTLNVAAANRAPIPTSDIYFAVQDTPLEIGALAGVLINDDDPDDDPLTAIPVQSTTHGQLVLNPDGSFSYTPDTGFSGTDSFTYRANDGTVSSPVATVTIDIRPTNTPPVAVDDDYTVAQNGLLEVPAATGLLANDQDNEVGDLTAQLDTGPTHGSLSLSLNGSFTYTPESGFAGTDSFTYHARDGAADSNSATVTITVEPLNSFDLLENSTPGTLVGQLNLIDPDLDGSVIFQFEDPQLDPLLRLVPDDHLSGLPASGVVLVEYLDYQCPACQIYQPTIDQLESDFVGQLLVVRRHLPLTDVHDNAFAAAVAAEAAGRQNKFDEMGDLLFQHQSDWEGAVDPQPFFEDYASQLGLNITQFVSDQADPALVDRVQRDADAAAALGAGGTPTFYLDGEAITDPPTTVNEFSALIQSRVDQLDNVFLLNRRTGQLLVRDDQALDFETTPSFTLLVRATDLDGDTEVLEATVHLIDMGENPPQAMADEYQVTPNTQFMVDAAAGILANDSDPDDDPLFVTIETSVAHGTLVMGLNGAFSYTPAADFTGVDQFVYRLSDGHLLSDPTPVTLTVEEPSQQGVLSAELVDLALAEPQFWR